MRLSDTLHLWNQPVARREHVKITATHDLVKSFNGLRVRPYTYAADVAELFHLDNVDRIQSDALYKGLNIELKWTTNRLYCYANQYQLTNCFIICSDGFVDVYAPKDGTEAVLEKIHEMCLEYMRRVSAERRRAEDEALRGRQAYEDRLALAASGSLPITRYFKRK